VVGVFVGNEHGVETIDFAADGSEASKGFAFAESGVNEDAGGLGFEQREIARTAGGEDGDAKTDGDAPGKRDKKCATLKIMAERWEGVNVEGICAVEKARAREEGPGRASNWNRLWRFGIRRGTGKPVPYKSVWRGLAGQAGAV
jgi:hypothetical protein